MRKLNAGIAALLVLCGAGVGAVAGAEEKETYTYSTYMYCDLTAQDRIDEIVGQLDKPVYDAAVASGSLINWGWLKHDTGGQWRRVRYYSASSLQALMDIGSKLDDQAMAAPKAKALNQELRSACKSHDDYIWRSVAGGGGARGAAGFSVYYVCDITREEQADALVKRVFAPLYDKLVADGQLTSWGWMEHVVGGQYRRLATLTAKDMTTLMAARAAVGKAMDDDPLGAVFDGICGSHADYIWETAFTKP